MEKEMDFEEICNILWGIQDLRVVGYLEAYVTASSVLGVLDVEQTEAKLKVKWIYKSETFDLKKELSKDLEKTIESLPKESKDSWGQDINNIKSYFGIEEE